jgi:anthranilate phosphoribosyltransferase
MFSINEAIIKLARKENLTRNESQEVFLKIISGEVTETDLASFLTALSAKRETPEEIAGAALALRKKMFRIAVPRGELILDSCGTGGTGKNTFNISTSVALVVSACGVKVAKHGNRSATSSFGSADAMEALGVNINLTPKEASDIFKKIGIVFLFAPNFHPAMKYATKVRKSLGFRTIFNLLGPLCNPALSNIQVVGVYDANLTEAIAWALKELKTKKAFVVHGMDGLDEVTLADRTKITELNNNEIRTFFVTPQDFGLKKDSLKKAEVKDAKENTDKILAVLHGTPGVNLDIVLANASCCLVVSGAARDFKEGVILARQAIKNKGALKKLELLKQLTNKIK